MEFYKNILLIIFFLSTLFGFSQSRDDSNWCIGFGGSNFIMGGDLSSSKENNTFWNLGAYLYVDKMFNEYIGIESKINKSKTSGSLSLPNSTHSILYIPTLNNSLGEYLFFEGRTKGVEISLIFNINSLFKKPINNLGLKLYLGMGHHRYDSALYGKNLDGSSSILVDFRYNPSRNPIPNIKDNGKYFISSYYKTIQISFRYALSDVIDIEFRPSWNINNKDELDAAISKRNKLESFYNLNLGIVFKN